MKSYKLSQFLLFGVLLSKFNLAGSLPSAANTADLYSEADGFPSLTIKNFKQTVLGSDSAYLVEFYNSWCGYCIRFAPVWKEFARNIQEWKPAVHLAAVNCADQQNVPLCAEYGITTVPHIKVFPPRSTFHDKGTSMHVYGEKTVQTLAETTAVYLTHLNHDIVPSSWPRLEPVSWTSVSGILRDNRSPVVLVVEKENSPLGTMVVLDNLDNREKVPVYRVSDLNSGLIRDLGVSVEGLPALVVIKAGEQPFLADIPADRESYSSYVQSLVLGHAVLITTPTPPPVTTARPSNIMPTDYRVYSQDLENALYQMLMMEVPSHSTISGRKLSALRTMYYVLAKYLPVRTETRRYLRSLYSWSKRQKIITSEQLLGYMEKSTTTDKFLPPLKDWVGCKGSQPLYRGYPCGLWTTFHVITVHHYLLASQAPQYFNRMEALYAISGYVRYFFACEGCSKHFQQMASNMSSEVVTNQDSVLWLWRAHNKVNKRLAGDPTEDPQHPKTQFPPYSLCPECHKPETYQFDEPEVLKFLTNFYKWSSFQT